MDRVPAQETGAVEPGLTPLPGLDLLPTRRAGREALRVALGDGRGVALLTGEAGVGKTALWRSLEAATGRPDGWVAVEASPTLGAVGLYRRIGRALGVGSGSWSGSSPFGSTDLLDLLAERSLDADRRTLVVDEAQNLDAEAMEEVRLLAGRVGRDDGFAAILVVGQTPLARRVAGRAGAALAARLRAHVHLRPLDADEVGLLLRAANPGDDWPVELADRIHLVSGGRPARVLDLASRVRPPLPVFSASPTPPAPVLPAPATEWESPLIGPTRPPIRVEEGLIEVGWEPEPDAPPPHRSASRVEGATGPRVAESESEAVERIEDHYAALQAWQEWATNQDRHLAAGSGPTTVTAAIGPTFAPDLDPDSDSDFDPALPLPDDSVLPLGGSSNLWVDEEHGFAPYGRLFGRAPREAGAE